MTTEGYGVKYPSIDRTNYQVCKVKNGDGILDIGWTEGRLTDGRPYRAELWAQDQVTVLTVFFSALGLEDFDTAALSSLIETHGVVSFGSLIAPISVSLFQDGKENTFWSVNIAVGDEESTFIKSSATIYSYVQSSSSSPKQPHLFFSEHRIIIVLNISHKLKPELGISLGHNICDAVKHRFRTTCAYHRNG